MEFHFSFNIFLSFSQKKPSKKKRYNFLYLKSFKIKTRAFCGLCKIKIENCISDFSEWFDRAVRENWIFSWVDFLLEILGTIEIF
jgi:hypothetical protein